MKNNEKHKTKKTILKNKNISNKKDELKKNKSIIGKYYSFFKNLENNKKIKPNLKEIISFDKNFINVNYVLNQFNILNSGKMIFKIYLNSVLNDKIRKTLEFNIYVNNKIKKTLDYPLGENFNGNFLILTDLELNKGDIVYFVYSIKEKIGKLKFKDSIYYEIEFFPIDFLEYKSSQIVNDSLINKDQGINYLLNKLDLDENKIINLKKRISILKKELEETELPVGTIILGSWDKPYYGNWVELGVLDFGNTIIGGKTSLGSVSRHKHIWSTGYTAIGNLDKGNSGLSSFNTFDKDGNQFWMGKREGTTINKESYINNISSSGNVAYSLGVDFWVVVYKRIG